MVIKEPACLATPSHTSLVRQPLAHIAVEPKHLQHELSARTAMRHELH